MERKELKKKLKEVELKIKNNSTDVKFAEALIKELESLKGQIDVEQSLVNVPLTGREEVIKSENEIYTITRNSLATVFHVNGYDFVQRKKGGVDVVIKNYLRSAHTPFDMLFDYKKKSKDEKPTQEEEEMYGTILNVAVAISQAANIASYKEEWQCQLYLLVESWLEELNKELDNQEVSEETNDDMSHEVELNKAE